MKLNQAQIGILCPIKSVFKSMVSIMLAIIVNAFPGSAQDQRSSGNMTSANPSTVDESQQRIPPEGLEIGDKIPENIWNLPLEVINHSQGKKAITLNNYRGKLIILDFWATWCGSCIAAMPKLHKLQTDFNKDIVVLPITYQQATAVTNFIQENSQLKRMNLLSVVNYDSFLRKAFPHQIIPHVVWISPEGNLAATTAPDYVTAENIDRILAGDGLKYIIKTDIDTSKPLFIGKDLPDDVVLDQYSIFIRGQVDGLPGSSDVREKKGRVYGYAIYNKPMSVIYRMIIRKILDNQYSEKRIIFEVDTSEFFAPQKNRSDLFSYEVNVPPAYSDSLYHIMLARLNQSSKYHCKIEEKYQECLVLTSNGSLEDLSYTGKDRTNTLFRNGNILRGYPLSRLVQRLNFEDASGSLIVLDETGYVGNVDIQLNASFNDRKALREELNRYGLDLITAWRRIPMFIFTY